MMVDRPDTLSMGITLAIAGAVFVVLSLLFPSGMEQGWAVIPMIPLCVFQILKNRSQKDTKTKQPRRARGGLHD